MSAGAEPKKEIGAAGSAVADAGHTERERGAAGDAGGAKPKRMEFGATIGDAAASAGAAGAAGGAAAVTGGAAPGAGGAAPGVGRADAEVAGGDGERLG